MMIVFGPLRLCISLSRVEESGLDREEAATLGLSDAELAHLDRRKTQDLATAHWEHFHLFIGGTRRP
jgi:hypothetical protein